MMAGGGAGSGNGARAGVTSGNGPAGGGTAGGGARAVAATTRAGAAGGPGDDTRASAIAGDHGGLLPRVGRGAPDSRPHFNGGRPRAPCAVNKCPERPACAWRGAPPVSGSYRPRRTDH